MGAKFRRAQLSMIAAPPGVGKSLLALNLAVRMNVPTLVFTADTDGYTTKYRVVALQTGRLLDDIEVEAEQGVESDVDLPHVRWVTDPSPSLIDIEQEVLAFVEWWGSPPELIVVDNLMNVQYDGSEFEGMRVVLAELHKLARVSGAHVAVLHHTTGEFDGSFDPAPRRAIHGKVSQLPELILTLGRQGQFLIVAVVKNRTGPVDPAGVNVRAFLYCDPQRATVIDPPKGWA